MTVLKTEPLFNPQGDMDKSSRRMIGGNTANLSDFNNMKYTWVSSWYRQAMSNFWIPEETNLSTDVEDCRMLSGLGRDAFDKILGFLVFLDSIQAINLPCIGQYITANKANSCLTMQGFQEAVHSQSYSYMLDSICSSVERDCILCRWEEGSHLLQRNTFIGDLYNEFQEKKDDVTLLWVMMANYILEGIYFCSRFVFPHNPGRSGKVPGSIQETRYINRDENTHLWLFRNMITEPKEEESGLFARENMNMMKEVLQEGMGQEIQWGCYMIGDRVPRLTKDMATSYARYLGSLYWTSLGFGPLHSGSEEEPKFMASVSYTHFRAYETR